jgi:hypothetical protein
MSKHPNEMNPEELDLEYGNPVKQPMVTAIVSTASNENHDIVSVEVINEQRGRLVIPFTQSAIKALVFMCVDQANTDARPKAH